MLSEVSVEELDAARAVGATVIDARSVVGGTGAWVRSGRPVSTVATRG